MSYPVEALAPTATTDDIKRAIARSITQCINEGKSRDSCTAAIYRLAEKSTGRTTSALTTKGMEYSESMAPGVLEQ